MYEDDFDAMVVIDADIYDSYWCRYDSEWLGIELETNSCSKNMPSKNKKNVHFVVKLASQAVVWKEMS